MSSSDLKIINEVKVRFVNHEYIKAFFKKHYPENKLIHKWYRKGGRGYALPYENIVYVCADHYDPALLTHEILHTNACGTQKHPHWWQFWRWLGIMNPSGTFRWFFNVPKSWYMILKHIKTGR